VQAAGPIIAAAIRRKTSRIDNGPPIGMIKPDSARDVVPEFISLLTSKMETSVAQRRLVLTSLYRDFHGETNAGKASEIVKSIQRLFPETYKQVWRKTEMGISVGQVMRWLREEIPERVKHSEHQNTETGSMEHFYFYG
jgi:hypothetical protein